MSTIILSIAALAGMGLLFGAGLSFAAVKFHTSEDPRMLAIKSELPNANCGGCGYAGCEAFAAAVHGEEAPPDACPVGGPDLIKKLADIMGVTVVMKEKMAAYVKCAGGYNDSNFRYQYHGMNHCGAAMLLAAGGSKSCSYGCLGGGSCEAVCVFDAIHMKDGIAVIDNDACTACGMCVKACPKKLIELVPYGKTTRVACNARDNAKTVRSNCKVGCISCKLCVRACEHEAVQVEGLLAQIIYEKCTKCNECVDKCPAKCIRVI